MVTLNFESRTRSRGKTCSRDSAEVAWFFERGEFLRHGDCLIAEDGQHIAVAAAPEPVSKVIVSDEHLMTRIAYHLGNRHVPLQVDSDCLLYQPDHVLDEMVRGLGGEVTLESLPFQPEDGAYHAPHSHTSHSHTPHNHSDEDGHHHEH